MHKYTDDFLKTKPITTKEYGRKQAVKSIAEVLKAVSAGAHFTAY